MGRMPAPYVFISYKSEDVAYAREVVQALEAVGLDSWAAYKSVRRSHAEEIPPAIQEASAFVVLLSSRSCASDEVIDEVYLARQYQKELRLPILLPGEVGPLQQEDLSKSKKSKWSMELTQRNYHPWESAEGVATQVVDGIAELAAVTPSPSKGFPPVGVPATTHEIVRGPLALVSSLGMTYQLDGIQDLRQNLLDDGDPIATDDLGLVVLAPDGSVIGTLNGELEVAIWTLGSAASLAGPALDDVLPPGPGTVRLLAIERPIGQAIRIMAARGGSAYSVIAQRDGTWTSEQIATGEDEFVGGTAVVDDLLLVREGGDTVWAGDHAKRPFGLRSIRGVDSAFGPDGRQYLAGWGTGMDGSPQVEAVVESGKGWERVHRGPGDRAGIIRVLRDAARQSPEPAAVAIAVQSASHGVELVSIVA
jgi:TIR domain